MSINLLGLDNDILEIIRGYVKKDNEHRLDKEDNLKKTDFIMNYLKKKNKFNKYEIGEDIYSQLFKDRSHTEEEIKEYVIQKKKLKNMLKHEN